MRKIYTLDAETDPFKAGRVPAPFIWGLYSENQGIEEYFEFETTKEVIQFLSTKHAIVYAHNGGKFDYHFMSEFFEPFSDVMIINGRIAKFFIGLCEFRDSYNIIPRPLKAYEKDKIDYAIMEETERFKPENLKIIKAYLRNDCKYLYEMVKIFIDNYGFNLTLASSAMKFWSKQNHIKPPDTPRSFYNRLHPFYYGGRVECFYNGIIEKEFKVIDINSAYPFAMTHYHPYGEDFIIDDRLPVSKSAIEKSFIRLTAESTGAFPFRSKSGLQFPNDGEIREFTITGWEYLAALETGNLKHCKIHDVYIFDESITFTNYVEHFFKLKADSKAAGNKANTLIAKLFLNSLYGKFAANPDHYNEYIIIESDLIDAVQNDKTNQYIFSGTFGKWAVMQQPLPEERQRYYNIAVAASITGFVRAYLYRAMNKCKGVMYCDTDSISCEDTSDLAIGPNLGEWELEAVCNYGAIAGKKMYAFQKLDGKWKTATKGVKISPEEVIKLAMGETVTFTPIAPTFSYKKEPKFISRKVRKT